MKAKSLTLTIFLIVTILELLSQIYGWETLNMVVKPILMPSLAAYFYFSIEQKNSLAFLVIVALLLSWLGDVFLLFQELNTLYFIFGLVSFLLAHITYIFIFKKSSQNFKPKLFTYSTGFLLIVYGFLLLLLLWTGLGNLKVAVVIYTAVIMVMGITSLFRKAEGASFVLIGAMLFIASDSLLAVNKFYQSLDSARFWIMITYILAQYFIVTGMINCFAETKEN